MTDDRQCVCVPCTRWFEHAGFRRPRQLPVSSGTRRAREWEGTQPGQPCGACFRQGSRGRFHFMPNPTTELHQVCTKTCDKRRADDPSNATHPISGTSIQKPQVGTEQRISNHDPNPATNGTKSAIAVAAGGHWWMPLVHKFILESEAASVSSSCVRKLLLSWVTLTEGCVAAHATRPSRVSHTYMTNDVLHLLTRSLTCIDRRCSGADCSGCRPMRPTMCTSVKLSWWYQCLVRTGRRMHHPPFWPNSCRSNTNNNNNNTIPRTGSEAQPWHSDNAGGGLTLITPLCAM